VTAALPSPQPERTPETGAFWDATADHRLLLHRCAGCDAVVWYPRSMCPVCGGTDLRPFDASGRGTVYSYTVVHRSAGPYRETVPYVVAYVELAEGPRVLTNVVGCDPADVAIGQEVQMVFSETGEGSALYRFQPVGAGAQ